MKQLLIVAIGCLPLAWLTAVNLVLWKAPPETVAASEERPRLNVAEMTARATSIDRRASDDLPFIRGLIALEPFADSLIVIDPLSTPDRFKPVAKAWHDYGRSQAAVLGATRVYRLKLKPADEVEKLKAYLATSPLTGLRDGDAVDQWMQQRITLLTEAEQNSKSLDEIRRRFAARQYDDVLKKIATLPTEVLSAAEKSEVERMRGKAAFGLHWQGWMETGTLTPALARTRLARLSEMLKTNPLPVDDEDQAYVARREQEKADLSRKLRIDDLFDDPPDRLLDLAEECGRILDDDPRARVRLLDGWRRWIEARLITKKPPKFHPDEKEAWEEGGRYRRGVFKPSTRNKAMYLYWPDPETVSSKAYETEIYLKQLKAEPDEMLEVRYCRKYNELLAELMRKIESRSAWEDFATSCEDMQQDLTDYYTRLQSKQRVVSFQSEGQLAREVLNEWPKLLRILKP